VGGVDKIVWEEEFDGGRLSSDEREGAHKRKWGLCWGVRGKGVSAQIQNERTRE
jgi:hypothetical protein